VALVRKAGLDPTRDLRFENWSGVSFRGRDVRGWDFTGARLIGCDFTDALIAGARFDQVEIDWARPRAKFNPKRTSFKKAADWLSFAASYSPTSTRARQNIFPVGLVFQDAPFAPELVVTPAPECQIGTPNSERLALQQELDVAEIRDIPSRTFVPERRLALGRFPTTFDEWDFAQGHRDWMRLTKLQPRQANDEDWGRGSRPVMSVSWGDAVAYCMWLSGVTGYWYCLPSEIEWEYFCRAGTNTRYAVGDVISKGDARFLSPSTSEVGEYDSNAWGIYDMHGNIQEWCGNINYRLPKVDTPAQDELEYLETTDVPSRIVRGGFWADNAWRVRSGSRNTRSEDSRDITIGFRVARILS
jgi:formylglycine-generating enzyme required for sulfatase activity